MSYLAAVCVLQGAVLAFCLYLARLDRKDAARERSDLAQRIQAPQMAAIAHHNAVTPQAAPPAVSEFDDEDYWESREELADRLAAAEVNDGH